MKKVIHEKKLVKAQNVWNFMDSVVKVSYYKVVIYIGYNKLLLSNWLIRYPISISNGDYFWWILCFYKTKNMLFYSWLLYPNIMFIWKKC